MDQVKAFLNRLRDDPKARETVSGKGTSGSLEEEAENYTRAAESLGYHFTARELIDAVRAMEREQKAKTGDAETAVSKAPISEDALDAVAGGKDHSECADSYQDFENCWITDQCDIIFSHYGTPQNDIDIDYDQMCADSFETYEEKFGVETW